MSGIDDILEQAKNERKETLEQIEERIEQQLEEEKKLIELRYLRERDEKIALFENNFRDTTQFYIVSLLQNQADHVVRCSSRFQQSKNYRPDKPMSVSFLYGLIDPEDPNILGIVIPTYRETFDNGRKYLPDRMKALVLETLLQAQNVEEFFPFKEISWVDDHDLTIFTIKRDYKTDNIYEEDVLSKYSEQLCYLESMLREAFENDLVFEQLGITFEESQGRILKYFKLGKSGLVTSVDDSEEKIIMATQEDDSFISEEEVLCMIYGLNPSARNYQKKLELAGKKFSRELKNDDWEINFNHFDKRNTEDGIMFDRDKILKLINGRSEDISDSAGNVQTIHKHYCVRTTQRYHNEDEVWERDETVLFFPLGAYVTRDVTIKFGHNASTIGNYASYNNYVCPPLTTILVKNEDGKEITLYEEAELVKIAQKKK